jgi:hypothetical protein
MIGYVPQLLSADGSLSGYENLLVFAKLYDIPAKGRENLIRDSLHFMGLSESSDRLVRSYSGGMIRRLEIAQGFCTGHTFCVWTSRPSGCWTLSQGKPFGSTWAILRKKVRSRSKSKSKRRQAAGHLLPAAFVSFEL